QALSVHSHAVMGATYSGSRRAWTSGPRISLGALAAAAAAEAELLLCMPARARSSRARSGTLAVMRVAAPGAMALQVTPYRPRSLATTRVRPAMPALAAP